MANKWRVIEGNGDFENLASCRNVQTVGSFVTRGEAQRFAEDVYEGAEFDQTYFVIIEKVAVTDDYRTALSPEAHRIYSGGN